MIRKNNNINITNDTAYIIKITNENDKTIIDTFNNNKNNNSNKHKQTGKNIIQGYKQERATNFQGWKTVQIVSK
jgi:predicted peptidase